MRILNIIGLTVALSAFVICLVIAPTIPLKIILCAPNLLMAYLNYKMLK